MRPGHKWNAGRVGAERRIETKRVIVERRSLGFDTDFDTASPTQSKSLLNRRSLAEKLVSLK
jgi:hypothetical protein